MKKDKYEQIIEYILENQDKFYRLAYSYVREKEGAMDIVQNAICKALEHYKSLREISARKTWFYRILVNESIDYIRIYKKEIQVEEPKLMREETFLMQSAETQKEELENTIQAERLYIKIQTLPEELRHIIELHYFEELTLVEIAKIMDMNLSTVKAKLYRGLKKIKIEMEDQAIWEE